MFNDDSTNEVAFESGNIFALPAAAPDEIACDPLDGEGKNSLVNASPSDDLDVIETVPDVLCEACA